MCVCERKTERDRVSIKVHLFSKNLTEIYLCIFSAAATSTNIANTLTTRSNVGRTQLIDVVIPPVPPNSVDVSSPFASTVIGYYLLCDFVEKYLLHYNKLDCFVVRKRF